MQFNSSDSIDPAPSKHLDLDCLRVGYTYLQLPRTQPAHLLWVSALFKAVGRSPLVDLKEIGMQCYEKSHRWDKIVKSIRRTCPALSRLPHQAISLCRSRPVGTSDTKASGSTVGSADSVTESQAGRSQAILKDIRVIIPCLVSCFCGNTEVPDASDLH